MIVHSSDRVVLVGGADIGPEDLNISQSGHANFVAVDGGADHLLAAGIVPDAVIGDLDSISDAARDAFAGLLHRIDEQESVDFEKAVSRISAPLIYAVGFAGGRLDHSLAVLDAMARLERRIILVGRDDLTAVIPRGGLHLAGLEIGQRISLMPMAPAVVQAEGLQWPVSGKPMAPLGFASPSNAVSAPDVVLRAEGPVLLIGPREMRAALDTAMMG